MSVFVYFTACEAYGTIWHRFIQSVEACSCQVRGFSVARVGHLAKNLWRLLGAHKLWNTRQFALRSGLCKRTHAIDTDLLPIVNGVCVDLGLGFQIVLMKQICCKTSKSEHFVVVVKHT